MTRYLRHCVATMRVAVTPAALASFHLFRIEQLYSNADRSVQFVVMHQASGVSEARLRLSSITVCAGAARLARNKAHSHRRSKLPIAAPPSGDAKGQLSKQIRAGGNSTADGRPPRAAHAAASS